ncbi:hypothetical protein OQA88_12267 [Cercophora sp. LCS_1]
MSKPPPPNPPNDPRTFQPKKPPPNPQEDPRTFQVPRQSSSTPNPITNPHTATPRTTQTPLQDNSHFNTIQLGNAHLKLVADQDWNITDRPPSPPGGQSTYNPFQDDPNAALAGSQYDSKTSPYYLGSKRPGSTEPGSKAPESEESEPNAPELGSGLRAPPPSPELSKVDQLAIREALKPKGSARSKGGTKGASGSSKGHGRTGKPMGISKSKSNRRVTRSQTRSRDDNTTSDLEGPLPMDSPSSRREGDTEMSSPDRRKSDTDMEEEAAGSSSRQPGTGGESRSTNAERPQIGSSSSDTEMEDDTEQATSSSQRQAGTEGENREDMGW